jgi:hypothetical protein
MATQKAYLQIEQGAKIPCEFNPAQLAIVKSNSWTAGSQAGGKEPQLKYSGANPGSVSLDLIFDTTDTGDPVTTYTDQLMTLMEVNTELPGADDQSLAGRPPYVTFNWGGMRTFKAVVEKLSVTFVYFAASGAPLRAKVGMELKQFQADNTFGPQNPTSGTPRPHRVHRVQPGETLDRIAAQHYGDANRWRVLAAANGIEDPLALRPGSLLSIPRAD